MTFPSTALALLFRVPPDMFCLEGDGILLADWFSVRRRDGAEEAERQSVFLGLKRRT